MTKNQNPQNMGGPSFTPDVQSREEGTPSYKNDPKSEKIREKHGADYDNYGTVKKTPDNAAESSPTKH